jgi:hypothetical protein
VSRRQFKIGDRVVIVRGYPQMIGCVTTVTSGIVIAGLDPHPHAWPAGTAVHELSVPATTPGVKIAYPPSHLELFEPGSGAHRAEWDAFTRRVCGLSSKARKRAQAGGAS